MAYVDNGVPFGSQAVTIGSLSIIAESINLSEPSTIIERSNQVGDPSGQVIIGGFASGSAVLQLATTAITVVTIGATFTLVRNNGAMVGEVVSTVDEAQSQFDAHKHNIGIRRRYGS